MTDTDLLGKAFGNYRLERQLGRGGMGEVYLGRHTVLHSEAAVKILPWQLARDERYRERFFREARSAFGLKHQHIVTVIDAGESEGHCYLIMEFCPCGSLRERIGDAPMPVPQAMPIMRALIGALQFAHEQGFIHRDVKPDNVLFGEGDVPKLADFGLAREAAARSTDLTGGNAIGTPHYMPIEQWEGGHVDARLDQYALGVVFYEMLTGGRRPIEAPTPTAVLTKLARGDRTPLADLRPDLPQAVINTIETMTAKHADDRFRDLKDASLALKGRLLQHTQRGPATRAVTRHVGQPARAATMHSPALAPTMHADGADGRISRRTRATSRATPPPATGSRIGLAVAALAGIAAILAIVVVVVVGVGGDGGNAGNEPGDRPNNVAAGANSDINRNATDTASNSNTTNNVDDAGDPVRVLSRSFSGGVLQADAVLASGTYIIDSDIEIPVDATLTIQAGAEVHFRSNVRVRCAGTLIAQGTEAKPIALIARLFDVANQWAGIELVGESASATLSHVAIEGARGQPVFEAGEWDSSRFAMPADAHSQRVRGGAVVVRDGATLTLEHCTIANCEIENVARTIEAGGGVFATGDARRPSRVTAIETTWREIVVPNGGGAIATWGAVELSCAGCVFDALQAHADEAMAHGGAVLGLGGPAGEATWRFEDCEFTQCEATALGGAVLASAWSDASFVRCTFRANQSGASGGAIALSHSRGLSTVLLDTCRFEACESRTVGGALAVVEGVELTARACVFEGNYADTSGGAVAVQPESGGSAIARFDGCDFVENTTARSAGAMHCETGASVTLVGCTLRSNATAEHGGAVLVLSASEDSCRFTATGCTFADNRATQQPGYGGALCMTDGTVELIDSDIVTNSAANGGGLAALERGVLVVTECRITENSAQFGAGAEIIGVGVRATFRDATFVKNTAAALGGGLAVVAGPHVSIDGGGFTENYARNVGGGLFTEGARGALAVVTCEGVEFNANTATTGAGAYSTVGSEITHRRCAFIGNIANELAGGIWGQGDAENGAPTIMLIEDCTFDGNVARLQGRPERNGGHDVDLNRMRFDVASLRDSGLDPDSDRVHLHQVTDE